MKKIIFTIASIVFSLQTNAGKLDKMNCSCEGSGKYTFVFEAGMGNWSLFFQPVAQELKQFSKVCLIDRKGYATREIQNSPKDAKTIARQMKEVLEKQRIVGAVILVGHSMGGLNVRMFQSLYPGMVAGMILLDAAHPHLWKELPELRSRLEAQKLQMEKIRKLAKLGLLHFAKKQIPTYNLPAKYHKDYFKVVTRAYYYETYIKEMEVLGESLLQCEKLHKLGNLPLLVIGSTKGLNGPLNSDVESASVRDKNWLKLQLDLTYLSSNSTYVESQGDHFVHLSDKETVVHAIKDFYSKNFTYSN